MKVFSVLVAFVLLQAIMCEVEGVTVLKLQKAFNDSLPYLKAFNPKRIKLAASNKFSRLYLNFTNFTHHNIEFKYDEFNILHVKFVNLKPVLTGSYLAKKGFKSVYANFQAQLNKVTWATSFSVKVDLLRTGKKELKYKMYGDGDFSFNVERFTLKHYTEKDSAFKNAKAELKNLNFKDFKEFLRKSVVLTLDTLKKELK
jgi:hypothetical protein